MYKGDYFRTGLQSEPKVLFPGGTKTDVDAMSRNALYEAVYVSRLEIKTASL